LVLLSCIRYAVYQIDNLLIVDFKEGALHKVLGATLDDFPVNALEQILEGSRDEPTQLEIVGVLVVDAHHREGLAGARLTVGENAAVVSCVKLDVPSRHRWVLFIPTFSKMSFCESL
jgi:hypothetical protein